MRIIHGDGFQESERVNMRHLVYQNVITSMQTMVRFAQKCNYDLLESQRSNKLIYGKESSRNIYLAVDSDGSDQINNNNSSNDVVEIKTSETPRESSIQNSKNNQKHSMVSTASTTPYREPVSAVPSTATASTTLSTNRIDKLSSKIIKNNNVLTTIQDNHENKSISPPLSPMKLDKTLSHVLEILTKKALTTLLDYTPANIHSFADFNIFIDLVEVLWSNHCILECYQRRREYQLSDSTQYYLQNFNESRTQIIFQRCKMF